MLEFVSLEPKLTFELFMLLVLLKVELLKTVTLLEESTVLLVVSEQLAIEPLESASFVPLVQSGGGGREELLSFAVTL